MFAVVKIAGQQFKVTERSNPVCSPHWKVNAGDKVEFAEVLLVDNDGKLSSVETIKAIVKAEIVGSCTG